MVSRVLLLEASVLQYLRLKGLLLSIYEYATAGSALEGTAKKSLTLPNHTGFLCSTLFSPDHAKETI